MGIGKQINERLGLGAKKAYYYKRGNWFHPLGLFPGVLIDQGGYLFFNSEKDYLKHPHLVHGVHVHVGKGINGIAQIQGYVPFTEEQKAIIDTEVLGKPDEKSIRTLRTVNLLQRDQSTVNELKSLYDFTCQICLTQISVATDRYYIEVHHIKPLGQPHCGPDTKDNMIVVCPNCHVKLDYVVMRLDKSNLTIKHHISDDHIKYHNRRIRDY